MLGGHARAACPPLRASRREMGRGRAARPATLPREGHSEGNRHTGGSAAPEAPRRPAPLGRSIAARTTSCQLGVVRGSER